MGEQDPADRGAATPEEELARRVGAKARRRLSARRRTNREIWLGLGAFGVIGWSVAVPTIVLTALGVWLDRAVPVRFSWTLTMLGAGIVLGCLNAWLWVSGERRIIERWSSNDHEQTGRRGNDTHERHD